MRAYSTNKSNTSQVLGPPEVTPSMTENDARPSKFAWPVLFIQLCLVYLLSSVLSWYLTLTVLFLYFHLKHLLFQYLFDLEELTPMDYFFLYDNYKNRANILCVSIWQKFDYERVRK